jgi:3-phosphoshikimate 1-carboxyvinyltransferase
VIQKFEKFSKVTGTLSLPGDKSISHRALMISALSKGKSHIENLSSSDDVKSTIDCLRQLGIEINTHKKQLVVSGNGYMGFKKPVANLNAGNSGTTARLLSGILVAQDFHSTIKGDNSLSERPMRRIIEPLKRMGAKITCSKNNTLPIKIYLSENLSPIRYQLKIASAQVKSAILFAGLHIEGKTEVIERYQTRNHTENLLNLDVEKINGRIISSVSLKNYPDANKYFIPGDISSAMYFVVLALLTKNSELRINNISLNKTRTTVIDLLIKMGAKIETDIKGESQLEEYGDIIVKSSKLINIKIDKELVPQIIDEVPILAIAGLFAEGKFKIDNVSELRVKESDRVKSLCANLSYLGLDINEAEDGFSVSGTIKKLNPEFRCFGDHRIAMAFSILSCLLANGGSVKGFESVSISNPDFLYHLKSILPD